MKAKQSIALTGVLAVVILLLWLGFRSSTHVLGGGMGTAQLKRSFGKITILLQDDDSDGEADYIVLWKWRDAHWSEKSMFRTISFGTDKPDPFTTWKRWTAADYYNTEEVPNKTQEGIAEELGKPSE